MNLAICEDNPQHYEIICSILRDLPENTFQTCHFSTGNELLETISTSASNCPYSIILMDIDLGENSINGITLADQINKPVSYTHLDVYKRQVLGQSGLPDKVLHRNSQYPTDSPHVPA